MTNSFSANAVTMKLSIIFLLLGFVDWSVQVVQPPRVSTLLGPVVGEVRRSSLLHKYEAYEGIPYARPPVKILRFRVRKSNIYYSLGDFDVHDLFYTVFTVFHYIFFSSIILLTVQFYFFLHPLRKVSFYFIFIWLLHVFL